MVLIYTTCRDIDEAKKIGELLVKNGLAACINTWTIESCYMWEGAMKCETEGALFIKTLESKVPDVENLIEQNHSYATPFIGAIEVKRLNRAYKEWMTQVIR